MRHNINFFSRYATQRRDTRFRCIADNANSKISSHPPDEAISKIHSPGDFGSFIFASSGNNFCKTSLEWVLRCQIDPDSCIHIAPEPWWPRTFSHAVGN